MKTIQQMNAAYRAQLNALGYRIEPSLPLAGMEAADQERAEARAEAEGRELTEAMRQRGR